MGIGFSYTFGLDKTILAATIQALGKRPGISEFDLAEEIGVGGKKGIAYSVWLLYLGLRKATSKELSPLGTLLLTGDPHLNGTVSLQLLHYQLCSNPNATVWWTLANKVVPHINEISTDKVADALTSIGIGINNLRNLRSDIGVFLDAYAPGGIFGPLNYLKMVGTSTYSPGRPELNPLLLAYILYASREDKLRTSTTSITSILFEDGQAGKIFLQTRTSLLEALRQLEFRGFVTVAQVADLNNIGYTYDGRALNIIKMCYEEERQCSS